MVNMGLLRQHVKERRIPADTLSNELGISVSTFYRLLDSNGEKITVEQAQKLKTLLSLSAIEFNSIFLAQNSQ